MAGGVEGEARKALNRLRHAVEKASRELEALRGALRHAEGDDFPAQEFEAAEARLGDVRDFADEQARRLDEKLLQAGGLEPGRVRRTGGLE